MDIQKEKATQSLHGAMREHYVDSKGKIIVEAVDLGMLILEFFSGMHEAKTILAKTSPEMGNRLDDFFLSLVTENMDVESVSKNRNTLNATIEYMSSIDEPTAEYLRSYLYGTFMDLLENKFFQYPTCNILLRGFLAEGTMRTINAYVFLNEKETKNIAYANFQCVNHSLAFIAFACNMKLDNYYNMNYKVEMYTHRISSKLIE